MVWDTQMNASSTKNQVLDQWHLYVDKTYQQNTLKSLLYYSKVHIFSFNLTSMINTLYPI